MTHLQRAFAIITAFAVMAVIVDLVRRRKLKEEYAWLWILTGAGMLVLVCWYGLLERLSRAIGSNTVTTTLFVFALLFLLVVSVHFSVVISRLTQQVGRLTQELAILEAERSSPQQILSPAPRSPADE